MKKEGTDWMEYLNLSPKELLELMDSMQSEKGDFEDELDFFSYREHDRKSMENLDRLGREKLSGAKTRDEYVSKGKLDEEEMKQITSKGAVSRKKEKEELLKKKFDEKSEEIQKDSGQTEINNRFLYDLLTWMGFFQRIKRTFGKNSESPCDKAVGAIENLYEAAKMKFPLNEVGLRKKTPAYQTQLNTIKDSLQTLFDCLDDLLLKSTDESDSDVLNNINAMSRRMWFYLDDEAKEAFDSGRVTNWATVMEASAGPGSVSENSSAAQSRTSGKLIGLKTIINDGLNISQLRDSYFELTQTFRNQLKNIQAICGINGEEPGAFDDIEIYAERASKGDSKGIVFEFAHKNEDGGDSVVKKQGVKPISRISQNISQVLTDYGFYSTNLNAETVARIQSTSIKNFIQVLESSVGIDAGMKDKCLARFVLIKLRLEGSDSLTEDEPQKQEYLRLVEKIDKNAVKTENDKLVPNVKQATSEGEGADKVYKMDTEGTNLNPNFIKGDLAEAFIKMFKEKTKLKYSEMYR